MLNKQIILVPDTVVRRLRRNNVSLDILLSPDEVVMHLSPTEVVEIEVLNAQIDMLLDPVCVDVSQNSALLDRRWAKQAQKLRSFLYNYFSFPNDSTTNCNLAARAITLVDKYNKDTMKFFKNSVFPLLDSTDHKQLLARFKESVCRVELGDRFVVYDNDVGFAVIGIADGAFNTEGLEKHYSDGKNISISMSLSKSFLKTILGVLQKYSTRPDVAVTDVYGRYARLLVAETLRG